MYVLLYFEGCVLVGNGPLQYPKSASIIVTDDEKTILNRRSFEFKEIDFNKYAGSIANDAIQEWREQIPKISKEYKDHTTTHLVVANRTQYQVMEVATRIVKRYFMCKDVFILSDYVLNKDIDISSTYTAAQNLWGMLQVTKKIDLLTASKLDRTTKPIVEAPSKKSKNNKQKNGKSTENKANNTKNDSKESSNKKKEGEDTSNIYLNYCNKEVKSMQRSIEFMANAFGFDTPTFDDRFVVIRTIAGEWRFDYIHRPVKLYVRNRNTREMDKEKLYIIQSTGLYSPVEAMKYIVQADLNRTRTKISSLDCYRLEEA